MSPDLPAALRRWRPLFRARAFGMHEPADIEGETALRVLQQMRDGKAFRNLHGIVGFLGFQTVVNLRRKKVVVFAAGDFSKAEGAAEATSDATPHDDAVREETGIRIREALARVDDESRQLLVSYYWDQNGPGTNGKKKQALRRAREVMRTAMVAS